MRKEEGDRGYGTLLKKGRKGAKDEAYISMDVYIFRDTLFSFGDYWRIFTVVANYTFFLINFLPLYEGFWAHK